MSLVDFEYSYIGSGIKIDKYTGSATSVDIPNNINGQPVTTIGEGAFNRCHPVLRISRTSNTNTNVQTNIITSNERKFTDELPENQNSSSGCLVWIVIIVFVLYWLFR